MAITTEPMANAIPGTVHLVDLDHSMRTRHAGGGDIVLDPTPSHDANDPLNWSPRRKLMSMICSNLYVCITATCRMIKLTVCAGIPGSRE